MDKVRKQLDRLLYSNKNDEILKSEIQEIARRLEEIESEEFEMAEVIPLFIYQVPFISSVMKIPEEAVVKKIIDKSFSITEVRHIVHLILKGNANE